MTPFIAGWLGVLEGRGRFQEEVRMRGAVGNDSLPTHMKIFQNLVTGTDRLTHTSWITALLVIKGNTVSLSFLRGGGTCIGVGPLGGKGQDAVTS